MKRIKAITGFFFILICCTHLPPNLLWASDVIPTIGTMELKHKLDQGEPLVLANALSPIEFKNLTIKGSISIPHSKVSADNPSMPKDKNQLLIFFCKGTLCIKSNLAARKAIDLGYTNVMVYKDGLPAWVKKRFPVTGLKNYPDTKIPRISSREVFKRLDQVILLDIRGKDSVQLERIKHGYVLNIPLDDLEMNYQSLPKDKTIVLVDIAGKQIDICGRFLAYKGYTKLVGLEGGSRAWFKMIRRMGKKEIFPARPDPSKK